MQLIAQLIIVIGALIFTIYSFGFWGSIGLALIWILFKIAEGK